MCCWHGPLILASLGGYLAALATSVGACVVGLRVACCLLSAFAMVGVADVSVPLCPGVCVCAAGGDAQRVFVGERIRVALILVCFIC